MGVNATTTVPVYADGEVLEASRLNVTNSGIPVFATTTTRDAAFGGTGEKVLAEGQFAYIEASDTTQYYDGAAWQTVGQTPGLQYITGASFTSATTISMASGVFTSTYKTYKVIFQVTSGTDCQVSVRVNNAGTPRTGASYYGGSIRVFTSATVTGTNAGTSVNLLANTAYSNSSITMSVYEPTNSARKTGLSCYGYGNNDSNQGSAILAGGYYDVTEANDGLTWIASNTISGFYRVYGLSES